MPATASQKPATDLAAAKTLAAAKATTNEKAILLDMLIPQIRLWVEGPDTLKVGEPATYRISAKNEGNQQVVGLLVSALVPAGVKANEIKVTSGTIEAEDLEDNSKSLLWQMPELPAGQIRSMTLEMAASKAEHFGMDIEWTVLPQNGTAGVDVHQPQLAIAIEGPSEVIFGKPELYRMRVRNPGNATVLDVEVSLNAESFGTNRSKIGDLPAGQERIVEVELTFQQAGQMSIVAGATSEKTKLTSQSKIDVRVAQVKLETACLLPPRQFLGAVSQYSFEVVNSSSQVAEKVQCELQLPAHAVVQLLPQGVVQSGTTLRWMIDAMPINDRRTLVVQVQMNDVGSQTIELSAKNANGANSKAEGQVMVESISDLKLTVVDPIAPAPVSEQVVYELIVHNRGSRPASDVSVIAQFSEGIEPVGFEGEDAQLVPGQVLFEPIAQIGAGEKKVLRITAVAAQAGMHRFRAEVDCDNGETRLVQEESTRYLTIAYKPGNTIVR